MPEENQEESQRLKGEGVFIKKPEGGFSGSFLEGLMKFQYGETAEASDQGFVQMIQATDSERIITSIYAFSNVHIIKADFNRDEISDRLKQDAAAVLAVVDPYLDSLEQAVGKDIALSEFLPHFSMPANEGCSFPIPNTIYHLTFGYGWGRRTAVELGEGRMETKLDIATYDPSCVGGSSQNIASLGRVEYVGCICHPQSHHN